MPFVQKTFLLESEIKAFEFMIREFKLSMAQAQRAIDRGRVLLEGKRLRDKSQLLKGKVEVIYFKPHQKGNKPIFLSQDFAIFDKPSGVLVHPNKMTTPYSMLDEVRGFGGVNANFTHRIDKETSGLLLASLNRESETFFKSAFEKREIKKVYRAWTEGFIDKSFTIEKSIIINNDYSNSKHKVYIDDLNGKSAKTFFKPIFYNKEKDCTLLECIPYTGRTHQIRVHLFHIGHPIIGDPLYGREYQTAEAYLENRLSSDERVHFSGAGRLMLHAYKLEFTYKNRFLIVSKNNLFQESKNIAQPSERVRKIFDGFK